MSNKLKSYVALAALAANAIVVHADIVSQLTADTTVVIIQPEALRLRLQPTEPASETIQSNEGDKEAKTEKEVLRQPTQRAGFRVQVFSDNNAKTAKNEARTKQRTMSSRFPKYRTYVTYTAPYWRTRIGDFRTEREANAAASEIRKAFPKIAKEIRVVRDRIND